jgi:hypothetical protein
MSWSDALEHTALDGGADGFVRKTFRPRPGSPPSWRHPSTDAAMTFGGPGFARLDDGPRREAVTPPATPPRPRTPMRTRQEPT